MARTCVVPERQQRALSVQVHSLWSDRSCGVGDLHDLKTLALGAHDAGYELLLLSPIGASLPGNPQEPSPYYPSSRVFRNPLFLRVDGAACGMGERVDRDGAWEQKIARLHQDFEAGAAEAEHWLFATFNALSEWFGRPWSAWPRPYRHPKNPEVISFAAAHEDRVRFHNWLQILLDRQLAAVADVGVGLVNDLPVGFDPNGFDAWRWQDTLATGYSVGAPPDDFNTEGQNWGLPPFDPQRLEDAGFAPFRAAIRAALDHAAGLRIDHVMGLFRLFWIPEGGTPADGEYVHYPADALLDIVSEESQRVDAFIVGEDLGTIEDWISDALRERKVLSYKVFWFEDRAPSEWPRESLASVTTHDLPTIAGVQASTDGTDEMRAKLPASLDGAASLVVVDTLEDILGIAERPNYPGADNPWNWSRPYPISVDAIADRLRSQT